mmetsp:Transcript_5587/g.8243  ORF Transcript_5587/g.8243 Transcript_5587/m.8243 type:complete len:186 (-) Transcript_5587:648-1205(-)
MVFLAELYRLESEAAELLDHMRCKVPIFSTKEDADALLEYNKESRRMTDIVLASGESSVIKGRFMYTWDIVVRQKYSHFQLGRTIGTTAMMRFMCGMDFDEFNTLMGDMKLHMQREFPKSKLMILHDEYNEMEQLGALPKFTTIRMKLFLTLCYLRRSQTTRELSAMTVLKVSWSNRTEKTWRCL